MSSGRGDKPDELDELLNQLNNMATRPKSVAARPKSESTQPAKPVENTILDSVLNVIKEPAASQKKTEAPQPIIGLERPDFLPPPPPPPVEEPTPLKVTASDTTEAQVERNASQYKALDADQAATYAQALFTEVMQNKSTTARTQLEKLVQARKPTFNNSQEYPSLNTASVNAYIKAETNGKYQLAKPEEATINKDSGLFNKVKCFVKLHVGEPSKNIRIAGKRVLNQAVEENMSIGKLASKLKDAGANVVNSSSSSMLLSIAKGTKIKEALSPVKDFLEKKTQQVFNRPKKP